MSLSLNDKFLNGFISKNDIDAIAGEINAAQQTLISRTGAGNDFLGWIDLPQNYDKEEFARIKIAAEKIKKSCDIFIVIGIGGSYLGARAAIEFVKSPVYNNLKKDTPDIYFAGNTNSPSAINDLLKN